MQNQISRREFVELSAATFGAVALLGSGIVVTDAYAGESPSPTSPHSKRVPGGGRILIAYATRCGSTAEIAEVLGKDLQSRGYKPEVLPVAKVSAVSGYQAILLGSAVRMGNWLPEATQFVRKHQGELKEIPTALFTVHIRNLGDDEKSRNGRLAYLKPVHELLRPDLEVFFAGRMDIDKLSFGERLMCKVMGGKSQDRRDWPTIHAWGSSVFQSEAKS